MNCPNCQIANPEGARFCFNCGTAMQIACSNCGTQLAPAARFCFNCGQPVKRDQEPGVGGQGSGAREQVSVAPSVADPQPASPGPSVDSRLQQYIPKELLGKLQAARANRSMAGERRIVTVLFCDVKGSTSMAEMLDPEEWAEIMNGAFEYLIKPVYKYEGTLARLMGDAILAFFGAPIGHEDDPRRATLAGLEIVESIKPYRERVKRERGFDFDVRVGINTGLVVVGEVGSDLRVEYTAMGDAVNVAARMEQAAEPGTVLISRNTHKAISKLFDFESLGELEVKGKSEPVAAYRVIGAREGAVAERGIDGLSSPLVGRERELRMLQLKVGETLGGSGQIVSVTGEAGLGKSRLLAELRKTLPPSIHWHEGRSLSYETNTPYAPFIDLFTEHFELRADDTDEQKYEKVRSGVEEALPGQSDMVAPFLASMMGIKLAGDARERVRYWSHPRCVDARSTRSQVT